jgi:hypothetical protein
MANRNQATKAKRDRERSRQERQQEKKEKRALRNEAKRERSQNGESQVDPDIAGIVPGPQPITQH